MLKHFRICLPICGIFCIESFTPWEVKYFDLDTTHNFEKLIIALQATNGYDKGLTLVSYETPRSLHDSAKLDSNVLNHGV